MPTPTVTRLSKSRIVDGLQCERRLWLSSHRRDTMETSPASRAVLDAGSEVGDLAMELYGPGLLIGHVEKTSMALAETAAALQGKGKRQTLFEAAFQHKDVLIRADVLKPVAGGYDLIEVKSSTSVKDYHLIDCAIQAWVIRNAGIPLRRVYLAHIDPAFVYEGDGNYNGLLAAEDVTDTLAELMEQVPAWVRRLQKILRGDEPSIATGEQCSKPFECPFFEHCRSQEPKGPKYPLTILPRSAALIRALLDEVSLPIKAFMATFLLETKETSQAPLPSCSRNARQNGSKTCWFSTSVRMGPLNWLNSAWWSLFSASSPSSLSMNCFTRWRSACSKPNSLA
ncbi:MAG: hypothetical protein ACTHJ9_01465 [Rhodanobacter sp.]